MIKYFKKYLLNHARILMAVSLFIVTGSLFILLNQGKASAVLLNDIPPDIRQNMSSWDQRNCTMGSYYSTHDRIWKPLYIATQSNMWLYYQNSYNDGSSSSPLQLQIGQNINLNILSMEFLCHMAISTNSIFYNDGNPSDGNANTNNGSSTGTINSPFWPWAGDGFAQMTRYVWGTPTVSGGGTVSSGIYGSPEQDICFQPSTRYWYPSTCPSPFGGAPQNSTISYTAPTRPGTYNIQVQLPIYAASWFDISNVNGFACLANDGAITLNALQFLGTLQGTCPPYTAYFNMTIKVLSPHPLPPPPPPPSCSLTVSSPIIQHNSADTISVNVSNVPPEASGYSITSAYADVKISNSAYMITHRVPLTSPPPTSPPPTLSSSYTFNHLPVGQYNITANIYKIEQHVTTTVVAVTKHGKTTYTTVTTVTPNIGPTLIDTCNNSVSGSGGPPSGSSGIPSSSGGLTVQYEPYFSVQGGDVLSGVSSTSISSNYDNSAGIYSWNQSGQGAGTTVAALATSNINQFVSGQSQGLTGLDPLTFANNTSPPYGGNYGTGGTSGTLDYYSLIKNMPGSKACPGSIGPMTLSPGTIYRCYTTSNITIAGDITANIPPPNTPPSRFPVFEIVTKGGNITIANNVRNLFGTYIAEINGSGGTISDTSNNTINIPSCLSNSTCSGQRLIINGSFIANQIYLLRAYGTQNDNNTPAEQFNYQPINWLTQGNTKQLYVQSISSLPPVL